MSLLPVASVFATRSDPARSHSVSVPREVAPLALSRPSTVIINIKCERELQFKKCTYGHENLIFLVNFFPLNRVLREQIISCKSRKKMFSVGSVVYSIQNDSYLWEFILVAAVDRFLSPILIIVSTSSIVSTNISEIPGRYNFLPCIRKSKVSTKW